jgi:exodeoxyribonuclease V beta subunit
MYLKLRLPDFDYKKHFGGVYYIFLRGVDPGMGPQFGIYRHRPSEELIKTLCNEMIG